MPTERDGRLPLLFALIAMVVIPILILVPGFPLNNLLISEEQGTRTGPSVVCAKRQVQGCGKAAGQYANIRSSMEVPEDNSNWLGVVEGEVLIPTLGTEKGQPILGSNDIWYVVCWRVEEGSWIAAYAYSTTLNETDDISKCTDALAARN